MRTEVCIIGGGPSGMLLAQLLRNAGRDVVVLERQPRDYVLGRIRAGVLEQGTVDMLRKAGVADRLERESYVHSGTILAADNRQFRIDFGALINQRVTVYGQTEVTKDLYEACGDTVIHGVEGVTLHDLETDTPSVEYTKDGTTTRIDCDFVAGCDGFHGVSRKAIPTDVLTEYERVYPFGWLGVVSQTPPVNHELIYAYHSRGFALCSMRNENLSRYYIQASTTDSVENWSDDAFWDELRRRLPQEAAETLITGDTIEKSIAPLRSFVAEPMRWGALFLVGDAAHIVPPTGAKGLNLAVSDVHYLFEGLLLNYEGDSTGLEGYSQKALARVWSAIRFSWWFTTTMHRFPNQGAFEQKIQESELSLLENSPSAQTNFAENYVGLPFS